MMKMLLGCDIIVMGSFAYLSAHSIINNTHCLLMNIPVPSVISNNFDEDDGDNNERKNSQFFKGIQMVIV